MAYPYYRKEQEEEVMHETIKSGNKAELCRFGFSRGLSDLSGHFVAVVHARGRSITPTVHSLLVLRGTNFHPKKKI